MSRTFEGWYFKHQAGEHTLAIIPGRSSDGAFIQVITEKASHFIKYPLAAYHKSNVLRVGNSVFTSNGVKLNVQGSGIHLRGALHYGEPTPVKGDIMGPFRFFPMECRHGIISMRHSLAGRVSLNSEVLDFTGGQGYIESDSGTSFPSDYTWVHAGDFERDCSIMVSVARIPFCGLHFWGCISVVWLEGREYRLATYKGAKIKVCRKGVIVLEQGEFRLESEIRARTNHVLAAPEIGFMNRAILESASCPARFRLTHGGIVIFEGAANHACYEYDFVISGKIDKIFT